MIKEIAILVTGKTSETLNRDANEEEIESAVNNIIEPFELPLTFDELSDVFNLIRKKFKSDLFIHTPILPDINKKNDDTVINNYCLNTLVYVFALQYSLNTNSNLFVALMKAFKANKIKLFREFCLCELNYYADDKNYLKNKIGLITYDEKTRIIKTYCKLYKYNSFDTSTLQLTNIDKQRLVNLISASYPGKLTKSAMK